MTLNKTWLFLDAVSGLSFGVSMLLMMAQSRPFRSEAVSSASTFKAVGIGIVSGLVFVAAGVLLGALYAKARPAPGAFEIKSLLLRVLIGTVAGGAIGATLFVPLFGFREFAVLILDYHGVVIYLTGAIGGGLGAASGAFSSTEAVSWWIRIALVLLAGLGGAVIGLLIVAPLFVALFATPFLAKSKTNVWRWIWRGR